MSQGSIDGTRAEGGRAPARAGERRSRSRSGGEGGIATIVRALTGNPRWRDALVHWHSEPARPGRSVEFPRGLDPRLVETFRARGIDAPWEHQARAIELALAGRDVLVATPTASG